MALFGIIGMTMGSMQHGIEWFKEGNEYKVRYHAPTRKVHDLRTECINDAIKIKNNIGPVYVLFSSGVDSQIIARCFKDGGVDAEYVFLNLIGHTNGIELSHVHACEQFFGIKVNVIDVNINQFKDEWIERTKSEIPSYMFHYPYEHLVRQLPEDWPVVFQGANEPTIIGTASAPAIYHNYYEGSHQRMRLMGKYKKVIDFPFSPEAITSLITDDNVKSFITVIDYFRDLALCKNNNTSIFQSELWNYFGKAMAKGRHFKKDIIWYGKLTGYELCPEWFSSRSVPNILDSRISVPYWDLVEFLENNNSGFKDYKDWIYNPQQNKWYISLSTLGKNYE